MYKKCFDRVPGIEPRSVWRLSDNAIIPFDNANVDYQEYLGWLAEGNTPIENEGV